jgi:hypothetical protein
MMHQRRRDRRNGGLSNLGQCVDRPVGNGTRRLRAETRCIAVTEEEHSAGVRIKLVIE